MYALSLIGACSRYRVGTAADCIQIAENVVAGAGWIAQYRGGHERPALEEQQPAELPTANNLVENGVVIQPSLAFSYWQGI